ncbi:MAG: methylated-DNA--[protein]-cysteine S-methyltransferase [Planctomycetota bacterium]|nr:MAG: methylated-DNA--[protein]-cysteine S-methyltransferase [Planctomycetota bacterium]
MQAIGTDVRTARFASMPSLPRVHIPDLYAELWQLLRQVPVGRVTTYGALARALGDVAAARWIGEFLRGHSHERDCVCHRVVRQDGSLGLYAGQPCEKAALLLAEGVEVRDDRVDLARFGFENFRCAKPLEPLQRFQAKLADRVLLCPLTNRVRRVGAVDVSYHDGRAVAAYVLWDVAEQKLAWSVTAARPEQFPYIPGYLAFRELPVITDVLGAARRGGRLADVVLVDGNGRLHHRHVGVASHVGVLNDVPTIGVGKSLLCGRTDTTGMAAGETRPVWLDDQIVAEAFRPRETGKCLYISPGHRVTLNDAVRVVRAVQSDRRVPEPIYWADRLSRRAARAGPHQ